MNLGLINSAWTQSGRDTAFGIQTTYMVLAKATTLGLRAMPAITPELRQAIEQASGEPVRIDDPETQKSYVLISTELYERIQEILEDEQQQKAVRDAGLRSAIRWMKDNPAVGYVFDSDCEPN